VDGKTKIGDIKERLVEEHDVTPEEAEKDILEYMQQLEEIKAIIEG
jgi:DNA-directed RNA polymerase subunit H (RpoH/RPB5)